MQSAFTSRRVSALLGITALLGGCSESFTGPAPSLASPSADAALPVDPGIICRAQHPDEGTTLIVRGEGLAVSPFDLPGEPKAALPSLALSRASDADGADAEAISFAFGGQPGQPNAELLSWRSTSEMGLTITDALALERGVYDLTATNAQGASTTSSGALAVVDPPSVDAVAPGITCVAQADRVVTVTGLELVRVGDALPAVIIGGVSYTPDALSSCVPVAHEGIDAEICAEATVTVAAGDLDAGAQAVELLNPETASCRSDAATDGVSLVVVDPPEITGARPPLVCTDEMERALTLLGDNFFTVDGQNPTVSIAGVSATVDALGGCEPVAAVGFDVARCTSIDITIARMALTEGDAAITVTNPDPIGCEGSSTNALTIPPSVTIDSIAPSSVCQLTAGQTTLTVTGAGFLTIDGAAPAVTFDGAQVTPTNLAGCASVTVDGLAVEACTSFDIDVDLTGAAVGPRVVTVTNAEPSGCGATADDLFFVSEPPSIASVLPTNICSEVTESITVSGAGFSQGTSILVGGVAASSVDASDDGTSIVATFDDGLAPGLYDVVADNGEGCEDTLASSLTVEPTPLVFFVDPPVVYDAVDFEVTIFSSGLTADAQSVTLVAPDGARTPLTNFISPARPNRILATIPAGLTPQTYEVEVTSDLGCVSVNNGELVVTDDVSLTNLTASPSFASPTTPTAITLSVDAGSPFVSTPRAYLNPNPAAAGVRATSLDAVVFQSGTELTGVVPGGLTPGLYDLIVVNPNGQVGFSAQAVTVTQNEPPVITSVAPQTFASNTTSSAQLRGANFDAAGGVTASLDCVDPGGASSSRAATVDAVTPDVVDFTVDYSGLSRGTICLVTVTNSDGAAFTYSAISVTNGSFNLEPWGAVNPMGTPRRGLGLEAGRPTATSRFLYAIGGDGGATSGALDSIEAAPVNVFGDLGDWRPERHALSEPKTLMGTERVGDFIYAVGGNDAAGASLTVSRARVLDPLDGPELVDIDAALGDATDGLGGGLYHYRVSAVFPASDPYNPLGESLPGEVLVVDLPAISDLIELTLTWEQIAGASGYRVYRTPQAGDSVDAVELLAEVSGGQTTSYVDLGAPTTPSEVPLPQGSLGTWHPAGALSVPREAPAVLAAPDPASPNVSYLYAFGGRDGATYHDSFEYAAITTTPNGDQTIGPWTTGAATLGVGRAELGAFLVDSDQSDAIPAGQTWIHVGPGRTGASGFTGEVDAFQVTAGGDVAGFTPLSRTVSGDRAGYGYGSSSGFLYIFGGRGGPNRGGISAELDGPSTLRPGAWNSLGIDMSEARVFMGSAQESAFYYIAGGSDGTNALSSVDQTVQ